MTNYIYLLYGDSNNVFTEAAYSIGTLRKRLNPGDARIIVFTDHPEKVKDWPVVCESVAGELAAMRGKTGYIHRAKLCVMSKCFEKYQGNMIFLDSDTFVRGNIARLAAQLSPTTAIMHRFESQHPELGISGFQAKLACGITYRFTADSRMYNSGVLGLHRNHREFVSLALELCDALLDSGSKFHTKEQFSVCEVLRISNVEILEARRIVTHYMGHRIYMRAKISEMSAKTGKRPWEFESEIPYSYLLVYWLKKFGYYHK